MQDFNKIEVFNLLLHYNIFYIKPQVICTYNSVNVPKVSISIIFDEFNGVENYNITLYSHKSKIVYNEEGNKYSAKLKIYLEQNSKKSKLVKQIFNKER